MNDLTAVPEDELNRRAEDLRRQAEEAMREADEFSNTVDRLRALMAERGAATIGDLFGGNNA